MKNYIFLLLLIFLCIFSFTKCEHFDLRLCVNNNSQKTIIVVAHTDTLANTVISWIKLYIKSGNHSLEYKPFAKIKGLSQDCLLAGNDWERDICHRYKDSTIHLFFFDLEKIQDVAKNSTVYPNDSLFKRYDFSLDSIKKLNWIINYP